MSAQKASIGCHYRYSVAFSILKCVNIDIAIFHTCIKLTLDIPCTGFDLQPEAGEIVGRADQHAGMLFPDLSGNTVTTGSGTIPMMKKTNYTAEQAAAKLALELMGQ